MYLSFWALFGGKLVDFRCWGVLLLTEATWGAERWGAALCHPSPPAAALRGHQAILFSSGVRAARNKHGWAGSTPREGRA